MEYVQYAIRELFPVAERIETAGGKVARVNVGDPVPYFGTPKYILDALAKAAKEGRTGYGRSPGEKPFLEAVARRYKRRYNFSPDPDSIFATYGVSEAIQFLNASLMEKGRGCLMFSPYYPAYIPQLKIYGGEPCLSTCDEERGWAPDFDELGRQARRARAKGLDLKYLHVINPCNPTGAVWGRKELAELAKVANNEGLLLVSDEIYDEMVFDGKFTSMCQVAKGQPLMLLNGLSKNWCATGLRLGWAVLHGKGEAMDSLRDAFTRLASVRLCASMPAQYAGIEALDNLKEHAKFVRHFNSEVKKRSDYCWKRLNEIPGISCQRARGAFYLFPKIDLGRSGCRTDKEFVKRLLEEQKVWAVQGSGFGCGGHLRIVTLPPIETLEAACSGIERMMGKG